MAKRSVGDWLEFGLGVLPGAIALAKETWESTGRDGATARLVMDDWRARLRANQAIRDAEAAARFGAPRPVDD